jgi:hypothetical protein
MAKIYHNVVQSINDNNGIISQVELPNGSHGLTAFTRGYKFDVPVPDKFICEVNYSKKNPPRHFITGCDYVVISQLFLDTLKEAKVDNFEVFPAILKNPETKIEWNNYYTFNEIGLEDAVLWEECKYTEIVEEQPESGFPGVYSFKSIVFSAAKLNNIDRKIFRLSQDRSLYFSDEVKNILDKNRPPEKWGITTTKIEVK